MAVSAYDIFDSSLLICESYDKLSVLDSCYTAIQEDAASRDVLTISMKYSHSLIFEILENVKNALLSMYQKVTASLNNYILNTITVVNKYNKIIRERYSNLKDPLMYETYEFKFEDNYPKDIRSSISMDKDIIDLKNKISDKHFIDTSLTGSIDKLLRKFSENVLGSPIDVFDVKGSTQYIVKAHILGKKQIKKLHPDEIDDFLESIKSYKDDKACIKKIKTDIISDYQALKDTYGKTVAIYDVNTSSLKHYDNPRFSEMEAIEFQKFGNVSMQLNRLFNGFIMIYQESFNMKIKLLQEKIIMERTVLNQVLARVSILNNVSSNRPTPNEPVKLVL